MLGTFKLVPGLQYNLTTMKILVLHRSEDQKLGRVKRIWYLSPMRAAKVQASLRIRAVSPEPPLLAHTSNESTGTFRQRARSIAPLYGWACAVTICRDGMLEDTNSLDGAQLHGGLIGSFSVVVNTYTRTAENLLELRLSTDLHQLYVPIVLTPSGLIKKETIEIE